MLDFAVEPLEEAEGFALSSPGVVSPVFPPDDDDDDDEATEDLDDAEDFFPAAVGVAAASLFFFVVDVDLSGGLALAPVALGVEEGLVAEVEGETVVVAEAAGLDRDPRFFTASGFLRTSSL